MFSRYTKLRVRRNIRRRQKQIEDASTEANKGFDKHVVRRWQNLREVRRFVIGWLVLIALLITGVLLQTGELRGYYLTEVPAAGGTFREGMVGEITNMNPIFATNNVDSAAAELIFSTLLTYNKNQELTGDLAKEWSVNEEGTVYTLFLRDDVYWHDGTPFTAEDVVFTFDLIQNPDAKSPLNGSWQGITVQAKDLYEVTFALPNAFTPFPHSLTIPGMLPKHLLEGVEPSEVRGHPFNVSEPVGTGPFIFEEVVTLADYRVIELDAYDRYHLGKPLLDGFNIRVFQEYEDMLEGFEDGELSSAAGLRLEDRAEIDETSQAIWNDLPLSSTVYVFFKTTVPPFDDLAVRQALSHATNSRAIIAALDAKYVRADSPLLKSHFAYDPELTQRAYDVDVANELLDKQKWVRGEDGFRYKDGQKLAIPLILQNSPDFIIVAEELKRQWAEVGVDLVVTPIDETTIQQNNIIPHNYQALLYGLSIGNDPDVFVYWHSSQAEVGGFNLSEVESEIMDEALESGRTRMDEEIRTAKYATFLEEWNYLAPATALYQPGFNYALQDYVDGFTSEALTKPEDRFKNVHRWQINTMTTTKTY